MLTALLLALATGAAAVPTTAGPVHIELRHHVDHSPGLVSREDSSLRLSAASDLYSIPFIIGTPPQNVAVIVSTGVSDLWLRTGASFQSSKSSSFVSHGANGTTPAETATFVTVVGTATGTNSTDRVTVAGVTTSQSFGLVEGPFPGVKDTSIAGVMGFGAAPQLGTPLWSDLAASWAVREFGLYLSGLGSGMTLGGTDTSKYSGSLTYVPVVNVSRLAWGWNGATWIVPLQEFSIAGRSTNLMDHIAMIDPGVSVIYGEPGAVAAFYDQIKGSQQGANGTYTVPCDDIQAEFKIGGVSFPISSSDLVRGKSGQCTGAVVARDTSDMLGGRSWVLGTPFIKSVYTSFKSNDDGSAQSVGLASLNSAVNVASVAGAAATPGATAGTNNAKVSGGLHLVPAALVWGLGLLLAML